MASTRVLEYDKTYAFYRMKKGIYELINVTTTSPARTHVRKRGHFRDTQLKTALVITRTPSGRSSLNFISGFYHLLRL